MIYYLGFRGESIVLFNSDLYEFKRLDRDVFFKKNLGFKYDDLRIQNEDALSQVIKKMDFPLSNKDDLVEGILSGKECQYLLDTVTSTHMLVATANMQEEPVKRIDNESTLLNANLYWMTWPEGNNYTYGTSIPCSAFTYACKLDTEYLEAKAELLDFANSGLQEALDRQMAFGLDMEMKESESLKGLCTYTLSKKQTCIDILGVPEGVTVLDTDSIPSGVEINHLILPSTLLFVQPKAIAGDVHRVDFSKTALTKLYNPFTESSLAKCHNLILPKTLVEVSKIDSNWRDPCIHTTLPKSVKFIKEVAGLSFDLEEDSELTYIGKDSYDVIRALKAGPTSYLKVMKDKKVITYAHVINAPRLQAIEGNAFFKHARTSAVTVYLLDGKLKNMIKSMYTRLNNESIHVYVEKDSELYESLSNKLRFVTEINLEGVEFWTKGSRVLEKYGSKR